MFLLNLFLRTLSFGGAVLRTVFALIVFIFRRVLWPVFRRLVVWFLTLYFTVFVVVFSVHWWFSIGSDEKSVT